MYANLVNFLVVHRLEEYIVLGIMIGALPMPTISSGNFYKWFFTVANMIGANLFRAKIGANGGANYDSNTGQPLKRG